MRERLIASLQQMAMECTTLANRLDRENGTNPLDAQQKKIARLAMMPHLQGVFNEMLAGFMVDPSFDVNASSAMRELLESFEELR